MLVFDYVKRTEEEIVYVTSNLEAFYDRKLPNIGGIVEESIGANRDTNKLFARVLLRFGCHAGIVHDVREESYRGGTVLLGDTGQENEFYGSAQSDTSCVIFKELGKKLLA